MYLSICIYLIKYSIYINFWKADNTIEMETVRAQLETIFKKLNKRIAEINRKRKKDDSLLITKSEVKLLGQMSLLANEKVSAILSLAQTGDMDALLQMEHVVKEELTYILKDHSLIYDEDSKLIWIPPGTSFEGLFDFTNVVVNVIDPESALVSKAVKAPAKNKQLIREAIVSEAFPGLVDRILKNGGKLENFS